ncbi:MAG TPA: molecular chaperone TorD family protein [Burkholderiales bacterium]|nr:molecular chaperone TorD family protein [Burkholderiales bacterium]
MSADATPLQSVATLPPEEAARANFYGLLARLFYAPPDAALLAALAGAGEIVAEDESAGAALALAWRDLMLAAAAADPQALVEEYETLFIGTGKAPVSLYAGSYLARSALDAPLAEVRSLLAQRRLARRVTVNEPEDHFGALCELMRHLIAEQQATLEEQNAVFERFLWPVAEPLCNAVATASRANFYRSVASFANAFVEVEYAAFRM